MALSSQEMQDHFGAKSANWLTNWLTDQLTNYRTYQPHFQIHLVEPWNEVVTNYVRKQTRSRNPLDLPQVLIILSQALWVKNLQKTTYFG